MNIYVGNLSFEVTEEDLHREFSIFGVVTSINMMSNKYIGSGQVKGYGFVEMASKKEAEIAVDSLKGKVLRGQIIEVVGALPLTEKKNIVAPYRKGSGSSSTRVRQRISY